MSFAGYADVGQPNNTLYLQNINERVAPRHLVPQLRDTFSEFGEVLKVIAKGRLALRGQAFIVFKEVEAARRALEAMQGVRLYGKTVIVRFARYKSDVISKADGTYEIEQRRREQDKSIPRETLDPWLLVLITSHFFSVCIVVERSRHPRLTRKQIMAQMAANPMAATMPLPLPMMPVAPGGMVSPTLGGPTMGVGDFQLPNKVLYLQLNPTAAGGDSSGREGRLTGIFRRFPGFIEVRLVPTRPDVAFVEYESEAQAAVARQATDGQCELVPGDAGSAIRVSFARR